MCWGGSGGSWHLEDDREALAKLEKQAESAVGYGEIREKKKSAEKNLTDAKTAAADAAEALDKCKTERETAEKNLRALQMLALMEQRSFHTYRAIWLQAIFPAFMVAMIRRLPFGSWIVFTGISCQAR